MIKEDPDLVLIDLDMGKQSGLEIVRLVKQLQGDKAKTLLLADPDEEEQIVEGFSIGINDFLSSRSNQPSSSCASAASWANKGDFKSKRHKI